MLPVIGNRSGHFVVDVVNVDQIVREPGCDAALQRMKRNARNDDVPCGAIAVCAAARLIQLLAIEIVQRNRRLGADGNDAAVRIHGHCVRIAARSPTLDDAIHSIVDAHTIAAPTAGEQCAVLVDHAAFE